MIKGLIKDTAIYGLGNALKKFIGLFLLPFYTKALTPSDYGVLETMGVFIFFLTAFMDFGLNTGTARYYYQATTEREKGRVLYTGLIMRLVAVIPSSVLAIFSPHIAVILFGSEEHTWVVFISCMLIPISMLNQEQANVLRYLREPWKFNVVTILRMVTGISLGISFVVVMQKGPAGAQLASLFSNLVLFSTSFLVFNRKRYVADFSWYWCKKLVSFGFPLIWASLALWLFQVSDRYILLFYHNTQEVGLYSLAFRFSQALLILNMAVDMGYKPTVLQVYESEAEQNKPKTKKLAYNVLNLYNGIGVVMAVFISVFSVEIVELVSTAEYRMAALAIPALTFGAIMFQSRSISAIGIGLKERTGYLMWILIVSAALNVGLNMLIIPVYSFQGAAFTTLISSFAYFIIAYSVSTRLFDIEAKVFRTVLLWVLSFVVCFSVPWLEINNIIQIPTYLKILTILLFSVLPFVLGLLSLNQLSQLILRVKQMKFPDK